MSASPPYWEITIQKQLGNVFWTNVWHCARSSQASAAAMGAALVELERKFHQERVKFVSYRVRPFPGPSEGTIYPVNEVGYDGDADALPLWNTMRVDFQPPTGRPSRKFWKMPIAESLQVDGVFTNAAIAGYQPYLDDFFASSDSAGLIDVDGQLLTAGVIKQPVGMRQLRRGSKKKTQPVIPVS